jgi:hypothetical protein
MGEHGGVELETIPPGESVTWGIEVDVATLTQPQDQCSTLLGGHLMNAKFLDVFSGYRGPQLGAGIPCLGSGTPEAAAILGDELDEEETCANILI